MQKKVSAVLVMEYEMRNGNKVWKKEEKSLNSW